MRFSLLALVLMFPTGFLHQGGKVPKQQVHRAEIIAQAAASHAMALRAIRAAA